MVLCIGLPHGKYVNQLIDNVFFSVITILIFLPCVLKKFSFIHSHIDTAKFYIPFSRPK